MSDLPVPFGYHWEDDGEPEPGPPAYFPPPQQMPGYPPGYAPQAYGQMMPYVPPPEYFPALYQPPQPAYQYARPIPPAPMVPAPMQYSGSIRAYRTEEVPNQVNAFVQTENAAPVASGLHLHKIVMAAILATALLVGGSMLLRSVGPPRSYNDNSTHGVEATNTPDLSAKVGNETAPANEPPQPVGEG